MEKYEKEQMKTFNDFCGGTKRDVALTLDNTRKKVACSYIKGIDKLKIGCFLQSRQYLSAQIH